MSPGPGAASIALLLASCGPVTFVDPHEALRASLEIVGAERAIIAGDPRAYLLVRIRSRDPVVTGTGAEPPRITLAVEGTGGRFAVPLGQASFQRCGEAETCVSATVGPGLPRGLERVVLAYPELDHEHVASLTERELPGHGVQGAAEAGNGRIRGLLEDPLRAHYADPVRTVLPDGRVDLVLLFPHTFDALVLPGACGSAPRGDTLGWTPLTTNPFSLPAVFDGDGVACLAIRPGLPEGGAPVAQRTIPARAVVERFTHVYVPPVEVSPLVFLPLFDLELPEEARCAQARDLVRSAVLEAATDLAAGDGSGAEILALDPVEIAVNRDGVPCRQENDRTFAATAVAAQVHEALSAVFGTRRVRVLLVYVTNLNLEPPEPLITALTALESALADGDVRRASLFAIAPERPLSRLTADGSLSWIATEEPSFRQTIKAILSTLWPFRTTIHTPDTVVPLLSAADAGRFEAYRLCSSTEPITLLGTTGGAGVWVPGPEGPAYRVGLPPALLVDNAAYLEPVVVVGWEGCSSLCERPSPGAGDLDSWLLEGGCR